MQIAVENQFKKKAHGSLATIPCESTAHPKSSIRS